MAEVTNQDLLKWMTEDLALSRQIYRDLKNLTENADKFQESKRDEYVQMIRDSFFAWYAHANYQPTLNVWAGENG